MTVATISAGVKTLLEAAGAKNVYVEEHGTFDVESDGDSRIDDGRVHFWVIRMLPPAVDEFVGARELAHRVRIEGFMEVARDAPTDGVISDVTLTALATAVQTQLTAPANRTPGSSLSSDTPVPDTTIPLVAVNIGQQTYQCHRVGFVWTITEDA